MNFLKKIIRAYRAASKELSKPESFAKGDAFEDYTREVMFPKDHYDLVYKTSGYNENQADFAEATLLPDFKFRCRQTKKEFYVESKWRNGKLYDNKISVCNANQLKRYKEIDRKDERVVIALGLGGSAEKPESVFLIPANELKYPSLFPNKLTPYKFYLHRHVFNPYLWKSVF